MPLPFWKHHLAVAALAAVPVLTGPSTALALPAPDTGAKAAPDVQKATSLFVKALDLFKAKKYSQALDAFKQSFAIVPSPNSHLYIARCLSVTGDWRAAWLEFDRTIDEATAGGARYTPTRDQAAQEREEVGGKIGLVVIAVPGGDPATRVRAGAYDVPPDRWGKPFPIDPTAGADVIVQIPGQPPLRRSVAVGPGERRDVRFDAPGPGGVVVVPGGGPVAGGGGHPGGGVNGLRIGAYVAGGVGVIGLIMFAAGGSLANSTFSSLQTVCGNRAGCPTGNRAAVDSQISTGKSQQALANAGIAIGVIGIAAGATLFVLSTRKKRVEVGLLDPHAHDTDAAEPGADFVVGPGWIGAQGAF